MNIVIGTANFLNRYGLNKKEIKKEEIKKIFLFCEKNKIRNLDTAFAYDKFKYIKGIKFDSFKISSKLNFFDNKLLAYDDEKHLKLIRSRIKELKIKSFDKFFIHNVDKLSKKDLVKAIHTMKIFKKKKLINKIGISIYNENSLKKFSKLDQIDVIQIPLNLCDRRFIKKKYINIFKKKKIEVQARSIFLQGLLLKNFNSIKDKSFIDKNFLINFDEWVKKNQMSKLQACLNFIKYQNDLDSFVIGVENLDQLKEILFFFKSRNNKNYPNKLISKKKIFFDPRKW
jgi:aryl-alcohol dehydrogenase-like predicted oxidoreductase